MIILFASTQCKHCNILLQTINRYDPKSVGIKIVYIEEIDRTKIPDTIHSVPSLYFVNTQEVIFGKDVFDYLFLPGRGKLVINNDNSNPIGNEQLPQQDNTPLIPQAVSTSSMELMYEELEYNKDEKDKEEHNKMEQWLALDTSEGSMNSTSMMNLDVKQDYKDGKKLPTLEEIMKQREIIS